MMRYDDASSHVQRSDDANRGDPCSARAYKGTDSKRVHVHIPNPNSVPFLGTLRAGFTVEFRESSYGNNST